MIHGHTTRERVNDAMFSLSSGTFLAWASAGLAEVRMEFLLLTMVSNKLQMRLFETKIIQVK